MSPQPPSPAPPNPDLEIKDARIIFRPIWEALTEEYGADNLRFPKDIILLGGAPGSGKGTNTAFIAKQVDFGALGSSPVARGLSAPLDIPYSVAFILDVAGDNEALVARNGAGITSITDLKGKRVATPFASTAHYSLLAARRTGP